MTLEEFKKNNNVKVIYTYNYKYRYRKSNNFDTCIIVDEGILIPEINYIEQDLFFKLIPKETIKEIYKKFILDDTSSDRLL